MKTSKGSTPTSDTGVKSVPPIGGSLKFVETNANDFRANVYRSFERTDVFQIGNISFYYSRISKDVNQAMGRFGIQPLLTDNTWSN